MNAHGVSLRKAGSKFYRKYEQACAYIFYNFNKIAGHEKNNTVFRCCHYIHAHGIH